MQKLKNKIHNLSNTKHKNYKLLNLKQKHIQNYNYNNNIMYIVKIGFSQSNTFLNVMDAAGNVKLFCSAGHFQQKGKTKKFRFNVFKYMYNLLLKLHYLKKTPIALHLKNVGFNRYWLVKKLKTKFFIKVIKNFNVFSYNGCRKRKLKRKKFKKEEMAEWFKAADCKSVESISS